MLIKWDRKISELHGVIHIHTNTEGIQFAKTTIDFDEEFMGVLCDNEGLLVHLNIPVRGLEGNRTFTEKRVGGAVRRCARDLCEQVV